MQLCWLALLLIRTVEIGAGDTWRNLSHELERIRLVTLQTEAGTVAQRTASMRNIDRFFRLWSYPNDPATTISPPWQADSPTSRSRQL